MYWVGEAQGAGGGGPLRWGSLTGPRDYVLGGGNAGSRGRRATKRCTGRAGRMRAAALGPSVGLRMGPRTAVLGM
eukprot:9299718-Pyramimonas_sp.AAC.1